VRAYWPAKDPRSYRQSQNWRSFIRNHARTLLACDFMVAVTARFRILYIFVVMEIGSRRILHCNVTQHPTSEWTIQQLREAIPSDHEYRYLIHDRHSTFSSEMDAVVGALGLAVVKTPVRAPQANAFCERLIGTMRRECLDFMIPLSERHLRAIVREWVSHYNRGRPHSRLGPGIPDQRSALWIGHTATVWKRKSASHQHLSWVDFTMNTHSNEPPLSARSIFCGPQPTAAQKYPRAHRCWP
jgi:putative transposase